jgi:hypothetical protein
MPPDNTTSVVFASFINRARKFVEEGDFSSNNIRRVGIKEREVLGIDLCSMRGLNEKYRKYLSEKVQED